MWSGNIGWFWRVSGRLISLVFGEDRTLEMHVMVLLDHRFWLTSQGVTDGLKLHSDGQWLDWCVRTNCALRRLKRCGPFLADNLQRWGTQPCSVIGYYITSIQWFLTSHSKVRCLLGISADNLFSCHLLVPDRSKCSVLTKFFTYSRWVSRFSLTVRVATLPEIMLFCPDSALQDTNKGL